jgi:hypothetical protein
MTKACKKRRGVCVSSEFGDLSLSTIFEVDESRLSEMDGVTSIPTCEHQSSYELKAESMNTRKIRWCTKILRKLMDHKGGWIFNQPVDPVLYGLPDYFDVIRSPMDLGTVKKRLTNKQYVSTDEFAADVRLTFSNAMKYNPPGNDVHAIAQQLNGIFDSKWESVKKKFRGPSPVQQQKTIFTKACKKRREVCVSSDLGDSSTVFEAEESRLSKKDGVTPIPTCEHQSSYELKAESMNASKIRLCGSIVRKLIAYKGGWIFKDPVDPVRLGIPDYFDVIRNPMDLGTVKNKLTKKKYVSIEEFAADVRLTFSNAMKYNPPGNDVHTVAKELNRVFDLLWESMERKFIGPSPVQEQKTIFTEVQALMDSKSTIGCSNSKPSVIRRPVACSNSIANKPLTDVLSFKVRSHMLLFTLKLWFALIGGYMILKVLSSVACTGKNRIFRGQR